MNPPPRRCSILLLLSLAFFANIALGESLSIIKEGDGQYWVEASAPQDTRFALQVSKDLHLWLDLNDAVTGAVSNRLAVAGVTQRYFRLVPYTEPPPIRIALLGDSTVADLAVNENHFYGWGQGMYDYFNAAAQIINLASPGLGTKNFLGSDQEARMLAIKPDYVLVDLCYVDAFNGPPEVITTLQEYEDNLKAILEEIRGFNGTAILLTPQALWYFDENDQTAAAYPDRNAVIEKVAAELQVYLIDLSSLSIDLLNQLGKDGSQYLYKDWLHFSEKGAEVMAGLVVNALPPSLGPYIVTDQILPSF
jgi:lysophospholipase L1-like esterase